MSAAAAAMLLGSMGLPSTAYANAGGTGDRTASITITQSGHTMGGSSTINNLIDGDMTASDAGSAWFNNTSPAAGSYIRFQFATPKYIDEFKFYQSVATSLGTWKWRGSMDGASFTDLEAGSFTLGNATTQTRAITHTAPKTWLYYQLEYVSGTVNNPFNQEIEFKIG